MAKKNTPSNQYDFSSIFWNASNFENASMILDRENARVFMSTKGPVRSHYQVPTVVCRAFSIELYLKCLIGIETGNVPRGHELAELYLLLSEQSRKAIKDKFDSLILANPGLMAMKKFFANDKSSPVNISLDIEDVLKVVNRVFETWRYSYEGKGGSSYGLGELSRAIRETIIALNPDIAASS